MKILIAQDSKLIREKIVEMLIETDQTDMILQAENFSETRDHIQKYAPEIVILDIHFSEGGGFEILTYIKKNSPKSKLIVLYNYPFPQFLIKFKEMGVDYILNKSYELEFISTIVKYLNVKQLQ